MKVNRIGVLLMLVALILSWVVGDDLAKDTLSKRQESSRLSLERSRLKAIAGDTTLPLQVKAAESTARVARSAAFNGPTPVAARAKMAAELQALIGRSSDDGTIFRLTRSTTGVGAVGKANTPQTIRQDAQETPLNALPPGFTTEAFSVSGTFNPANFLKLLDGFARSSRLVVLDGLSIKGSRFEVFGSSGLYVDQTGNAEPVTEKDAKP